jgi:hypothetical protein
MRLVGERGEKSATHPDMDEDGLRFGVCVARGRNFESGVLRYMHLRRTYRDSIEGNGRLSNCCSRINRVV